MKPSMTLLLSAFTGAMALFAGDAGADELRVPQDHATPADALTAAASGDSVVVADGEYVLTQPISFAGKNVTLRSENGAASTTLRMGTAVDNARASVVVFESGESSAAVIDGFTVTAGHGSRWGGASVEAGGGGILSRNGSAPTIRNCVITGNSGENGGGIMIAAGASATIEDCEVSRNNASGFGGGVLFVSTLAGCKLTSSIIRQNASASGGGLFCYSSASPEISGCTIESNLARNVAGGLCCLAGNAPSVIGTTFIGNSAFGAGALSCETGTDRPQLVNCLLVGNLAVEAGALQARSSAAPRLVNCTIASNAALQSDGGYSCPGGVPETVNSIVFGNEPASICGTVETSITEANPMFRRVGEFLFEQTVTVEVGGVPEEMPDFISDRGDWRLQEGSPAIDAAVSPGAPSADIDGTARPCGEAADAGAYELCETSELPPFRRGDSNGDGEMDVSDAVYVLGFLFLGGVTPPCQKSLDANDTGRVDISDAVYILGFLFLGGTPLPPPSTACDKDPTPDDLSCDSFSGCGG
jgi:hypothetical protein